MYNCKIGLIFAFMNKIKTRTLIVIFCLAISAVFGNTVVKTEDFKEKQSKYNNINSENNDLAVYRQQLIKQMEEDKQMYKDKMKAAKEQYEDLLLKQDQAIKEHTKTVAVVTKSYAPNGSSTTNNTASSKSSGSSSSKSTTSSSSSSSSSNNSSSTSSPASRPAPTRSTQGS